ncbi:hypothetical protein PAAG_06935 [Paracoccidioides lutzii Pb01]|uniref:EKC/KEOPS complex subunit BUD32 n=1 Tax=Paracoccidioides lutzii (strain ATCC MYA-826 / Pb01) TaxID=502779 RepID=C1H8D9_PARBA|nr:hypothetical protein PAAG_06935 [Paracoccidioides lutzii Pb01]EEH36517.2 hypothetical protein PAAG_06935 [Paracoccidioides lutzii Pb01]
MVFEQPSVKGNGTYGDFVRKDGRFRVFNLAMKGLQRGTKQLVTEECLLSSYLKPEHLVSCNDFHPGLKTVNLNTKVSSRLYMHGLCTYAYSIRKVNELVNKTTRAFENEKRSQLPQWQTSELVCCKVLEFKGGDFQQWPTSPLELLMVLRDAIKAHQSLYLDGNILHRDISENNIIITNPEKADGHTGMLINLDLAMEVGSERSGAQHQTSTMEYMVIEVLLNVDHTYHHDLESFFYMLIWQCGHRGWEKLDELQRHGQDQSKDSMLREWYTGTYKNIATYKQGNMEAGGFEYLLQEFPPGFECVKPLCRTIQGVLFPYGKEGLIVGTPQDPKWLYDPIIKPYDDAIALIET